MAQLRTWAGAALAVGALGAAGLAYMRREAMQVQFQQVHLRLLRLPPAFDGYRLAQLSDIHLDGSQAAVTRLEQAVGWIMAQQPDAVALTGDYVSYKRPLNTAPLVEQFRRLSAPDGVLAITGNHDDRRHRHAVEAALAQSGVTYLHNAVHPVRRAGASIYLCGMGSMSRRQARLDRVVRALNRAAQADGIAPGAACAILLAHEPDFADISAPTRRFDLQLSGHAHGGQVRLPLLTRLMLPTYGARYTNGLYLVKRMLVYASRGLGTTNLPLRFNCPPEVTLFTLYRCE